MKNLKTVLKAIFPALIIFFFGQQVSGQIFGTVGSKNVITQERQLPDFNSIRIKGTTDVVIRQGDKTAVVVKADDNLIKNIITKVQGDFLVVTAEGSIRSYKKFEVLVTINRLEAIEVYGCGDVESEGIISGHELSILVNGSGDVELNLDFKKLTANINGSGDIEVSGINGDLNANINGSGDFEASSVRLNDCKISVKGAGNVKMQGSAAIVMLNLAASGRIELQRLISEDVNVQSSGSGNVYVNVNGSLNARLSGSGNLKYLGNPVSVDVLSTGSGSVYK